MAVRWLMRNCAVLLVCLTHLDARRHRQRSATRDTDGEDEGPSPPVWTRRMEWEREVIHEPGETVVLSCPVSGTPKPDITWYRNSVPFRQEPGSRKFTLLEGERIRIKNWNLKVIDAAPGQSGNYTCIMRNEHGHLNWTFKVIIEEPDQGPGAPVLVDPPVNQTVRAGRAARLSCRAHTSREYKHLLGIQWLKHYTVNGESQDEQGIPYADIVEEEEGVYAMPDRGVLILVKATVEDSGWYTCIVDIEEYPDAVTHATFYVNVKPQRSTTTTTTTTPPSVTSTNQKHLHSTTTEGRKRKKHRNKLRGRKRRPTTTPPPLSTMEAYTEPEIEPEVEGFQTEVNLVESPERKEEEPEVRSSIDTESAGVGVRLNTLVLCGLMMVGEVLSGQLMLHTVYRLFIH